MLQTIHDKAKGWIAYIIVGIIIIPFALFGIHQYFEGGGNNAAAVVNGEEIPAQTVQNALRQLRQQFGGQLPPELEEMLKGQALDGVVSQTLLRQKIKADGYLADDQAVADTIAQLPLFQKDGKFDKAAYESFLKAQRLSPSEFEAQVRADLTQQQLLGGVQETAFLPKALMEQYQALRGQQRELELFTLKVADFLPQVTVTDEQVAQYYGQNKANYMTEERVQLAYVELKRDALAAAVSIDEAALQKWFDDNASRYAEPEARMVSHILVKVGNPNQDAAAKQRIDALYAELQAGKRSFEEIAKTDSDDKLAAEKEGQIGKVVAGDFEPEFEKAVFALKAGETSQPVKTEAGYEIIRVTEVIPAKPRTFEQARAEVEKDYRQEQAEKAFLEKGEVLGRVSYEQDGDLAPAAKEVGLEVQQTGWMTRSQGDGIANYPKVREAAFNDDVLKSGKNSDLIELADGHAVVVRVSNHEPAQQKPLEQVQDEIRKLLQEQEARKLVAQKGEELLKQLKESQAWAAAFANTGLGSETAVEKPGLVGRDGSKLPPEVLRQAFAMNHPAESKPTWAGVVQATGDYTAIALKAVKQGEVQAPATEQQGIYRQSVGASELDAFLQALREAAKVETFPDKL